MATKISKIAEAAICDIRYTSIGKGEVTKSTIIPFAVPAVQNIQAFDVTDYTGQEQIQLQNLWMDFMKYREAYLAGMFNFETWLEHTSQTPDVELKYRTFVIDNLETIE